VPDRVIERRVKNLNRSQPKKLARRKARLFAKLAKRSLNIRFALLDAAASNLPACRNSCDVPVSSGRTTKTVTMV
jgi:hypothetical protein